MACPGLSGNFPLVVECTHSRLIRSTDVWEEMLITPDHLLWHYFSLVDTPATAVSVIHTTFSLGSRTRRCAFQVLR
jgi:hypothetical protein